MFTLMRLDRYEDFFIKGRCVYTAVSCTTFINEVCSLLGISPDCVTKRVSFRLVPDDDLPF